MAFRATAGAMMVSPKRHGGAPKPMLSKLVIVLIIVLVGTVVWRAFQRTRQ